MKGVGLIIGSNLNDRLDYMSRAVSSLERHIGKLVAKSSVYVSPPWGYNSSNEYYNQVLLFETILSPDHVLDFCLRIESSLGRKRGDASTYQDRTIDIDILYYDDEVSTDSHLELPHPRMHLRKFCLMPLYEVNPDWIHPVLRKDLIYLIDHCEDNSELKRLD